MADSAKVDKPVPDKVTRAKGRVAKQTRAKAKEVKETIKLQDDEIIEIPNEKEATAEVVDLDLSENSKKETQVNEDKKPEEIQETQQVPKEVEKAKKDGKSKSEKGTKTRAPRNHPSYIEMVKHALIELGAKNGSSRNAIIKHIQSNFSDLPQNWIKMLNMMLKKFVKEEKLIKNKASFKLSGSLIPKTTSRTLKTKVSPTVAAQPETKNKSPKKSSVSPAKAKNTSPVTKAVAKKNRNISKTKSTNAISIAADKKPNAKASSKPKSSPVSKVTKVTKPKRSNVRKGSTIAKPSPKRLKK